MRFLQRFTKRLIEEFQNEAFLKSISKFEGIVAKILSVAMVVVVIVAIFDLMLFLTTDLFSTAPYGRFSTTITKVFGLFLNVLIALEILENITAYLKSHTIQSELVIVTSLIAVSRKIIILDLDKTAGIDLIALATAILALAISYGILRHVNRK
ncbi:phosphate-starvation-inducible PsiE family protein [Phormidium sp. CLA17]|uniref:phosphate-starvation-inducible PsiE family protein n=1 Tax=Leptolyngbya sp. Cla-17 TaxID=2803751 RepID=UPI001490FDF4|nr:phosphate-starvation-inducible PsiE family protein [Leptolyngbya sp. Cla-17]MBM0741601.1 phosphate-starvation-inducible PsiE family protein [Leptolyngbya sp. Cla-17]